MFQERDEFLRLIGFSSYEEYLQSALWEWIRTQLALGGMDKCAACNSRVGLVWHHRNYDPATLVGNLGIAFSEADVKQLIRGAEYNQIPPAMLLSGIVRLCTPCHHAVHFTDKGDYVDSLDAVDARLMRLVRCEHAVELREAIVGLDRKLCFDEYESFTYNPPQAKK